MSILQQLRSTRLYKLPKDFLIKSTQPIRLYWKVYGGWRTFFGSIYIWTAGVFTVVMTPAWLETDSGGSRVWAQLPLGILPNILGFSMGGMAIMLAFAGSRVFIHMTEEGSDHSYFMKIISSFYHFIMAQTIALIFGLFCKTYAWWPISFLGYWSMVYAILVALATASQIFNTARIANFAASIPEHNASVASNPSIDATPEH